MRSPATPAAAPATGAALLAAAERSACPLAASLSPCHQQPRATKQARRIKVALHYRQLTYHMATTSKLLLLGEWLAAAGFVPGTVARIEVEAGRLVITPAPAH